MKVRFLIYKSKINTFYAQGSVKCSRNLISLTFLMRLRVYLQSNSIHYLFSANLKNTTILIIEAMKLNQVLYKRFKKTGGDLAFKFGPVHFQLNADDHLCILRRAYNLHVVKISAAKKGPGFKCWFRIILNLDQIVMDRNG